MNYVTSQTQTNCECNEANMPAKAIAVINAEAIQGTVIFTQSSCSQDVTINVSLKGLDAGNHGFHVHEKGDISEGCTSMLGHYNPNKLDHGGPSDKVRHLGDLGNIEANDEKVCIVTLTDSSITLDGSRSIIGRGLVIHKDRDDFGKGTATDSKTAGNAGARIACAVIGSNEKKRRSQILRKKNNSFDETELKSKKLKIKTSQSQTNLAEQMKNNSVQKFKSQQQATLKNENAKKTSEKKNLSQMESSLDVNEKLYKRS